ncbi:MAG: IclR family transcriptional regulator [Hyphomicrobiaceae bacterium]|nr:IclR family transcriptional regulator [Hyphomicrobiaceae bacterium]
MADKPVTRDKGTSFLRVFAIIEAVVRSNAPLTAAEISRIVGLPAATTHRLCKMLLEERLLQYEIDGKRLISGPRLFEFAGQIFSGSHFDLDRRAILESLVEQVGETCNISVPDGARMIYAERVESNWPLRLQLPAGTHVPMHCTASGKLYLSHLDPEMMGRVLEGLEMSKYTRKSIVSIDKLTAELIKIRKRGYATDNEEFIEGLVAVAVPILDPGGRFCAGLALHGPKLRIKMKDAIERLPALQNAADQIARLMRREHSQ